MLRNGLMSKSQQAQCICGKPISMANDEKDFGTGTTLKIIGEKNKQVITTKAATAIICGKYFFKIGFINSSL